MLNPIRRETLILIAPILLIVAVAFSIANSTRAQGPRLPDPGYELSGQILTRVDEQGRIELCLRTGGGQVLCPGARFLRPDLVRSDRWIASSEVGWSTSIEPERIRYYSPASGVDIGEPSCAFDPERTLAATWKVETSRSFGTAFHIGGGRFITAHHVIDRRPPFVSLIHSKRTIGAVVLGSDREFDLALLEVVPPELVSDVPVMKLRAPTQDDVGEPVFVVGYPGGEALTLSGGGSVIQVWDDNIQTSSAIRGGNSGGPMFDACGDVIGVLWAGSPSWAYTNSGRALQTSLRRINEQWPTFPRTPDSLPTTLRAANRLIWHYGSEPPQEVDCSEVDGSWWIGVSGVADEAELRADLGRTGWMQVGVCGAESPEDLDNGSTYVAALEPIEQDFGIPSNCSANSDGELAFVDTVLFDERQTFGDLRLTTSGLGPQCPELRRFSLLIVFDDPQTGGTDIGASLLDAKGSIEVGGWSGKSYQTVGDAPHAPVHSYWQEWTAPADFDPVALRLAIGSERLLLPLQPSDAAVVSEPEFPTLEQRAQIVFRSDGERGAMQACLRTDGAVHCPADGGAISYPGSVGRWRETAPIRWSVSLPIDLTPLPEQVSHPLLSCAYQDAGSLFGWQFNSLAGSGTAVYVGERQFMVNASLAPEGAPWGVISRDETSHAVIRVAHDPRNDLALVELFEPEAEADLGRAAVVGTTSEELVGSNVHLLSYPAGDASRFNLSVLNVTAMTERVLRVEPTGIRRHGAPLVDPCSLELLGVSIGGDDLLRAETVRESLEEMRGNAERPYFKQDGPPAHGLAAVLGEPLYAGPVQPQFSGRICDVHPSERYPQRYAVYASNVDNPDVWRVYERDGDRPDTCDFGDKIFIIEYRADQPPEAVCIEPRRPHSPASNVEVELEGPDGVELLLVREFPRNDCPGLSTLEQTRWFSTHYFKLRNTGRHDFEDMTVRVFNAEDERYIPRRDVHTFADSDVWAWRVNVTEGEPVKVVVTVR
jgi:hypothetical protein